MGSRIHSITTKGHTINYVNHYFRPKIWQCGRGIGKRMTCTFMYGWTIDRQFSYEIF